MCTPLRIGNLALRNGDYQGAVQNYLQALDLSPDLIRSVAGNLVLARQRQRAQRLTKGQLRVAVLCGSLAQDTSRALALGSKYAGVAQVQLVDCLAPGQASQAPETVRRSGLAHQTLELTADRALEQALSHVAAHPCDLVLLTLPRGPNLLLGLLYKLLWQSRVLVDLGVDAPARTGAAAPLLPAELQQRPLPPLAALGDRSWTALAVSLAPHFDGVTGADAAQPASLQQDLSGPAAAASEPLLQLLRLLPPSRTSAALQALADVPRLVAPAAGPLAPARASVPAAPAPAPEPAAAPVRPIPAPAAGKAKPTPTAKPAAGAGPIARAAEPSELRSVATPPKSGDWTRSADLRPDDGHGVVELLGQALARLPRSSAAVPLPAPAMQAMADLAALHALHDPLGWRNAGLRKPWPAALPAPSGRGFQRQWSAAGLLLADVWWTSDNQLRWRIVPDAEAPATAGAPAPAARVLRCFQVGSRADKLLPVGDALLAGHGPWLADAALDNPFNPLLLVATGADGDWLAATLLPFPSLCRGGMHHAEQALAGPSPDPMHSLEALSAQLAAELLGSNAAAPPLVLAGLDVDLCAATGAEKLFSNPVQEWLGAVMRMDLPQPVPAPGSAADAASRQHLEQACQTPPSQQRSEAAAQRIADRQRSASHRLRLPADALPTLSVLVARRLPRDQAGAVSAGAYAVADPTTGAPRSLVSMPPMDEALLALQPRHQPLCFPLLRRLDDGPADRLPSVVDSATPLPLAIRFHDGPADHVATTLMPLAPDACQSPLKRTLSQAERQQARISVLLALRAGSTDIGTQLASLAGQTLASALDVVVALPRSLMAEQPALVTALEAWFPGRHQLLLVDDRSHSAGLNQSAALATGRQLLLLEPGVLLHDPRAVELLCTLSLAPRVATAACVLVSEVTFKKGTGVRFRAGGLYPSQLGFDGRPGLILSEPCTTHAFPAATYPVVGNRFRLAIVNAEVWRALGGLDAARFPDDQADVDFCLRALAAGQRHLCTSTVTASAPGDARPREHADSHALRLLPLRQWAEVLAACSSIRELRA